MYNHVYLAYIYIYIYSYILCIKIFNRFFARPDLFLLSVTHYHLEFNVSTSAKKV